ncbi:MULTISPECIES: tetratricopeptide repeat protein, partial [Roseomonadaceae]
MPSKIFFSSCFQEPKGTKLALRQRVIDGINPKKRITGEREDVENFPVWMAESWKILDQNNMVPFIEKAMFCVEGVRTSQTYVAVARSNYGSKIKIANGEDVQVSYFEMEIFEAALLQKPMKIFILEGEELTGRLKYVLDLLEPALPGLDRTPRSEDYIFACLQEMLEDLEQPRRSRRLRHLVGSAPRFTDQLMADRHFEYNPMAAGPPIRFLNGLGDLSAARPNESLVSTVLKDAQTELRHDRKLSLLWMAIRELMGAPPTKANDEFVPLWEQALAAWSSAGAWYGLHGHPYMGCLAALSSLNSIKAERYGFPAGPHSGFASEYYSISKQAHRPKYRKDALDMALKHIEAEALKGEASGTSGLRGSILYALGDRKKAIADFRRALELRRSVEGADRSAIGESMSELGFALVRSLKFREGLSLLEQGVDLLQAGPVTGFVVRAKRKLARKIHQGWRTWCKPLNGNRIRLRHLNPAVSG